MKKSVLLTLLINIYDDTDICGCFSAKKKLEFVIEKIKKEEIENDS